METADRARERPRARTDGADPAEDATVQGTVERITYHAPDTGYTVLGVEPEPGFGDPALPIRARVTAVGRVDEPVEGARVRLVGRWGQHRTHGRRFEFDLCEPLPPADAAGLVRYLASKAFRGIGETLAQRIVDQLGADAMRVILEEPEKLARVRGLRPQVRADLVEAVRAEFGAHRTRAFLLGIGLGPAQAHAVCRALGAECEEAVRADPYVLASGIRGIGFGIADRVARSLGFDEAAPERVRAGLLHALRTSANDGHTLLPRERLFERTGELLRTRPGAELLDAALAELERAREVVLERPDEAADARAYLPQYWASEVGLAKNLGALLASGARRPLADWTALREAESGAGMELHPLQREAVLGLLSEPLALLTGGPGVGKTTIVRLVVELAERAGASVKLASPTGRAAKRLAEATGRPASTVHRLLGFDPQTRGFAHGDAEPLEADLVVVDEISMLDVVLAHHLLKAIQPPARLVLVGDPDQLPSVSAGNVLADLLASGRVPAWRLTQVFRQDEHSLIVANAHRMLAGELPRLPPRGARDADFYFFPADDPLSCAERVVEVVTKRIPERFGLAWTNDVQVLAPMYRGDCGVDALNARLREALGHGGHELRRSGQEGEGVWRTGDRVIHTRNDYDKDVFNGDMGRIASIEPSGRGLTVRYPERDVFYGVEELGDLQPAFAITVHRSQGAEYPAVVVPLLVQHRVMLQRNLLYTAITRAKQLVVLVGSRRAIEMAIANAQPSRRESALAERLRAQVVGEGERC